MEENEEIIKFISSLENNNIDLEQNLIPLLEKANKYIIILNKYISEGISVLKELYSPYFPDLPTIVTNSFEYVKSIKVIEENKIKQLKQELSFLPNNVLMTLTFMLSSSNVINSSQNNSSEEQIKKNYEKILEIFNQKNILLNFISNHMKYLAPNLTLLLGPEISAKLVTEAGGLAPLARTPSGNILNMGRHELNLEGFSARKDAFLNRSKNNGNNNKENYGTELKKIIADKVEKIKNDVQPILKKPLPRPDDKPSKKRGGKRVRGIKKKFELTEVRKLKNRMKFGEPEAEYRDTGVGFGMLGVGGIGSSLRVAINKNNKIITKKQKMYDKKYGNKEININNEQQEKK